MKTSRPTPKTKNRVFKYAAELDKMKKAASVLYFSNETDNKSAEGFALMCDAFGDIDKALSLLTVDGMQRLNEYLLQ
jgi:hypothetical protein